MMRIAAFLSVLVFAVAASAAAPAGDDPDAIQIDAGRLTVMISQAHDVLPSLAVAQPPPLPGASGPNRGFVFDTLVLSVLNYNVLLFQACHTGAVDAKLCLGPWLPSWLAGKQADYSDAQLGQMMSDTMGRVEPFWTALCKAAPKPAGGEPVCPME